jgi:hypothetical protein
MRPDFASPLAGSGKGRGAPNGAVSNQHRVRRRTRGHLPARHMRSSSEAVAHQKMHIRSEAAAHAFRGVYANAGPRFPLWTLRSIRPEADSAGPNVSQLLAGTHSGPGRSPGTARVPDLRSGPRRRDLVHLTMPREATLSGRSRGHDNRGLGGGDKVRIATSRFTRHGRACPGHPRSSFAARKFVDARQVACARAGEAGPEWPGMTNEGAMASRQARHSGGGRI